MTSFFTGFSVERDPAGNLVAVFHMPIGMMLIVLATFPLVLAAGYALAGAPLGVSSWEVIFGGLFFGIGLPALGITAMFWQRSRASVRVTVDRALSRVLLDTRAGQTVTPIRDIEKAELGSVTQNTRSGPKTAYRLELVLRNGERAPATTEYFIAPQGDSEKVLEALNQELGARSAMLS